MSTIAANLRDRVMPERAVWQWVLTLPIRLRFRCALERGFVSKVLTIWHEEQRKVQTKRGWARPQPARRDWPLPHVQYQRALEAR
jgi:hypothetical protein